MKCLTICQPYSHLIVTPQAELPAGEVRKRVENRTWDTRYRGLLLIHAGKSTKWLRPGDDRKYPGLVYGAIVGVARLVDCVRLELKSHRGVNRFIPTKQDQARYPWLIDHPHTDGPFCWVLEDAKRFASPVNCTGRQGLFEVPDDLVTCALEGVGVCES